MDFDNIECVSSSDGIDEEESPSPSPAPHLHPFAKHRAAAASGLPVLPPATSVHELLECPVCTNSMYPPIHQCHNGHTLCSTCKTRVHNRCPTCRQELGDIRCLALEKVAESLELPCKFYSLGCPEIFPYYSKLKHEAQCNFRPYNCPYAGSECSVVGDIPFLVTHLRDDHKVDMHTGCTFNHRYVKSNPREVENATWMLTVFHCHRSRFSERNSLVTSTTIMAAHSNGSSGKVVVPDIKFTQLFINGTFVDSLSGRTFETRDPRTGDVIARVAEGVKEDVDLAVKAAREAFDHGEWPRMSGFARGRIMMKFADMIDQHIEELATLDSLDAGKLFGFGKMVDIPASANMLRYYAGAADKIHGETLKLSGQFQGYTLREPIGVVGHIIPWNYPSSMFFFKVSPALAAGCTMIVKPAEQTPLSALFYAHLAKQAGIPDGVLNVVTGFGSTAGAALSSHMDVDKISFTGSTAVGRLVMEAAAKSNLKSVSLELGGKSPILIFDDADLDMAVSLSLMAIFHNKGEVCVAGSRIYVQEGIYDEFVKKAVESTKSWVVGDPFDPNVNQGPQIDEEQFNKVLSYIEYGKRDGATLLTGGKSCGEKGYYIEPTIFTDVKEDMVIAQDEIFGPVMSLMKFKTVEEAIEKANNTKYGLAAGIVTKDLNIANRVSRSIRAGAIWVNCYFAFDRDAPFGGYKMSGFGRDMGLHAMDNYLQIKSVVTPIYGSPWL